MNDITGYINQITTAAKDGPVLVDGCVPSQMEHLLFNLGDGFGSKVIVTFDEQKALEILNNYTAFDKAAVYYPAKDPLFEKADIRGSYLSEQRLEVVKRLFAGERLTVITTLDAFAEQFQSFDEIQKELITIRQGEELNGEELVEKLVSFGYENESQVGSHGEFSIRGNIIDVFPYTESAPYRIDLWGDEVESIKLFDVESQRSIESVEEFTIFPAVSEQPSEEGEKAADGLTDQVDLFAYFDEKTLFVLDEPAKIFSEAVFEERLLSEFQERNCLQFSLLGSGYEDLPAKTTIHINARNIPSYN
ncbi:MAG: hypothetical protein IKE48_04250, partial [Parasporobacterium sp.]|nr:hypothetical protein [Parasporobacterium sp.]